MSAVAEKQPSPSPAQTTISHRRLVLVDVLIWVTTLLAVVAMFAVWANRQLLNPDNWATTSSRLLQDPKIRSATANYAVDQLYANVNVADLIRTGLPSNLQALAAPAAGALRTAAVQGAELALSRPRIQALWEQANRVGAQQFKAIVEGGNGTVAVNGGRVSLKLDAIVDQIAARLGLPSNLGAKLPPSIANLTVLKSNQLAFVQDAGNALQGLALILTIVVPLLYALAIVLAGRHRRRTLMTVGFAIITAGVLGLLVRSLLESQVSSALTTDASLRPAIYNVVVIGTGMFGEIAWAFVIVGAVAVVAAFFAGPASSMAAVRRAITPFLRDHPDRAYALTLAIMVLIFLWQPIPATGRIAGIIVFLALALFGTWTLRRQVIREFPDARPGEATAGIRRWWRSLREDRPAASSQPAVNGSISEQLERLAALHERGSITNQEYQSAKSALLGTAAMHTAGP